MAEIKIEKKAPIWPWILLAVAVIAILILIFSNRNDNENVDSNRIQEDRTERTSRDNVNSRQTAINNTAVLAYVSFIKEDPNKMDLDHEFTNEALLKLTSATSALANEIGYDMQRDLDEVRKNADKITTDPFETTHANSIRRSADILANVLQKMQQRAFPSLSSQAERVKNSASKIEAEVLALDQKGNIKTFFRDSADLLEKMNNTSPQM